MDESSEDVFQLIRDDWEQTITGNLSLTSSPMYVKHNCKPVICIWGIGLVDRPGTAEDFTNLINWLKSQGCYVIGGVPSDWRTGERGETKPGFDSVFQLIDMVSPWTVGRYSSDEQVESYKSNFLLPDKAFCDAHGIAYQPVFFPGFSWSNWQPGSPQNEIPRRRGELFWRQAYNIASANINSAYVAMFDEFDESTAIAKAAEDSSMIPGDQYFLTLSADGTYIQSDFYLRLTGEATKMIKGIIPLQTEIAIPYSTGPTFFRSSVEEGFDALPSWADTTDDQAGATNVIGFGGSGIPECGVVSGEQANSGNFAIRYSGRDVSTSESYQYFKLFDVDIPVSKFTRLAYWIYPQQDLGRYVGIDLIMSDGTSLRDSGALDFDGNGMHPGAGRGIVNTWNQVVCNIGHWLSGKTIDRIIVGYDQSVQLGDFRGYIDDITIANIFGDFDFDNDMDGSDLRHFTIDFINTNCIGECMADYDGNGFVDESDLTIFAANFGRPK